MKSKINNSIQSLLRLILFITLFSSLKVYSQTTVWAEGWEGTWTTNWHVDAGTWQVGAPTSGPNAAYTGTNCAATILDGNYPSSAYTRIIRHTSFQVPDISENPRLRFWHWFNVEWHDGGYVQIKVSGGDWVTISDVYRNFGGGWTNTSIDLSMYADSLVQIAFLFESDGFYGNSSGWYIDDVSLITGPITFNNPEDWESGLGDWYADRGTWQVGTPTTGPGSSHSGNNCAATVLEGEYPSGASTRLISPLITIPSITENPRLRFWHWFNIEGHDGGYVQIKASGGDWVTISDIYVNYVGGWTYTSIDLSMYADSLVQIAFFFGSDGFYGNSSGWYIDDVSLITGPITFNNPEDWESGLGDWYADRGTWQVGTPTTGPGSSHSGNNCAATVLEGDYPSGASTRLISPLITIPSITENPRLRFWHWFNIEGHDGGYVQIKASGGDWVTISDIYVNYGGGWTYTSIDLSMYADSLVQIAFFFGSDGFYGNSSGWYIDDVSLITGPITFNNPEDWESGLGDWYVDRGTWQVGTPTTGPGSSHSGNNCAATVLEGDYPSGASTRLISPTLHVSNSIPDPSIGFWHWFSIEGHDGGYVGVRDTSGNWQNILGAYSNSSGGWTYSFADLSVFAGQDINISFLFSSDGFYGNSSGWYIDEIFFNGIDFVPVELTSFTSSVGNGSIALNWETATETNNAGFSIERSVDNKGFNEISYLEGNGTTTEKSIYSFVDNSPLIGTSYYRLKQIDYDGTFEYSNSIEVEFGAPKEFKLSQNYPNPFNPTTTIDYSLPHDGNVQLRIFNSLGEEINTLVSNGQKAGYYSVQWNGLNSSGQKVGSGLYFYSLKSSDFYSVKKMILIK